MWCIMFCSHIRTTAACIFGKKAGAPEPESPRTAEQGEVIVRKQKGITGKSEQTKNTRSRNTKEKREVGRTKN